MLGRAASPLSLSRHVCSLRFRCLRRYRPWWKDLTPYHWFVFAMASLAWLFDCLDQQLFILARNFAMESLLPPGMDPGKYGTYATAIFVAGWATGGLIFGAMGDRIGRAKTLTLTVLMYSVFTGLSALSTGWIDFAIYRFLTGLGVGGVFGLAVALIADGLPDRSRAGALGTLQALSAVGNITAGLISMWVGGMVAAKTITPDWSWKLMFLIGALPAFLCVFLQMRLKEPEKWVKAREAGRLTGAKFGSYASLFGDVRWRGPAHLGHGALHRRRDRAVGHRLLCAGAGRTGDRAFAAGAESARGGDRRGQADVDRHQLDRAKPRRVLRHARHDACSRSASGESRPSPSPSSPRCSRRSASSSSSMARATSG